MRKLVVATVLLTGWVVGPVPAFAFQEVPAAPEPQGVVVVPQEKGQALTDDKQAVPGKNVGVKERKLKIPGLGSLDFLPKLDFGLEVMYGAPPQTAEPETATPETRGDDVMIRGTFKRRF